MFVLKSTYRAKCKEQEATKIALDNAHRMLAQMSDNFDKMASDASHWRKKLREEMSERMIMQLSRAKKDFTDAELTQLISLCHPDRHGGSKLANEVTAKLIEMRGKS